MKKYLPIIFLLLFAASTFAAESGLNPAGEAFVKAVNAGNPDAIAALYLENATSYPPDVPVVTGRDAIRKTWADLFTQFTAKLELTNGFYENHGDISIAWGQFTMTLTPKAGGEPIKIEGRYTDASKLEEGKWLYIVDHASVTPTAPPTPTK
jgi:ketosteroid isomerase-like protein